MPDLPVLGLGLGVGEVLSRVGGSKILGEGQAWRQPRSSALVKPDEEDKEADELGEQERTRRRSTDSRDVASALKTPEALARATSLASALRRLLVTL